MYINDIKTHFITDNCPSEELKELNLFVLMFAEDTVIFAYSPDELLQQVDSFHYLGLCLNYNGKFNVTQKKIADQGRKAIFCLNQNIQHFEFNTELVVNCMIYMLKVLFPMVVK